MSSAAIQQVTAKYSYLASWSSACGWRRARWRFLLSLTFAQLHRAGNSTVIYDEDD